MSPVAPSLLARLADVARFLVIGSHSVALQRPDMQPRPPSDTDLFVPVDALEALVAMLLADGFDVTSWEEPVAPPLRFEELRGRWYLRARRGAETIDLTYECPWLDFEDRWSRRVERGGVPLGDLDAVATLIAARNRPGDAERAAELRRVARGAELRRSGAVA